MNLKILIMRKFFKNIIKQNNYKMKLQYYKKTMKNFKEKMKKKYNF